MKYFKWTDEAKEKFIQMYPTSSMEEMMKEFPVKEKTIIAKACELKVKRQNVANAKYTETEDAILLDGIHNKMTVPEIQKNIPWRTIGSIQSRLEQISDSKRQYWTNEEDDLLKSVYEILPLDETIQLFPNRTRNAIITRAIKFGLHAYVDTKYYSYKEEEFILSNYQTMSDDEMALALGRSKSSIKNHRVLMGIYRTQRGNINYENTSIYVRRHNVQWKKDSMIECGFRCIVTGERFDEIHHLVSLNTILENVYVSLSIDRETFDINQISEQDRERFMQCVYEEQSKYPLGVCLRKDIHCQFHNQYGYGDNAIEQFEEFLHINYPNIKFNIN
jgi:hypothetical protein